MMPYQIRVEGSSDQEVVSGILKKFSYNLSVPSGYGSSKGRGAIIRNLETILEDTRFDKFLLLMDEDRGRTPEVLRKKAQTMGSVSKPLYIILIPGLETWVCQLLDPTDVQGYKDVLRGSKVEAARWAVSRFTPKRLRNDPFVQKLLAFCQCQHLSGHQFPTDFT